MKNACVITCVALLLGFGLSSCSAGTAVPQHPDGVTVRELEREFHDADSSDFQRLRAATELVRRRVPDPRYWSYVKTEGREALDREQVAAREWHNQQREKYAGNIGRVASLRVTDANLPVAFAGRRLDASNLPWITSLAMANRPDARNDLRRAVDSDNVLISAQASLGLASLKDHEWVPNIVNAAHRFSEDFPFVRALVYFGTTQANDEAAQLMRHNPELLKKLQATAKSRNYQPFGAK